MQLRNEGNAGYGIRHEELGMKRVGRCLQQPGMTQPAAVNQHEVRKSEAAISVASGNGRL